MTTRACTTCGQPATGPYCPTHTRNERTWADRKQRAHLVARSTVCAICGLPPTPHDPLTADHITPRHHGGPDHPTNYRPAHRSCNSRRGAASAWHDDPPPSHASNDATAFTPTPNEITP